MNKKRPGIMAIALTLAAVAPAPAVAQGAAWHGSYVWEEDVGRHGGSTSRDSIAAFITYTLRIGPNGCRLDGQGLQTNKRIRCTVTTQGRSATIRFAGYGSDSMFDDGYRPGQPLFTLTRGPRGIVTRLEALRPSSDATPRSGRLFRPDGSAPRGT